MMNTTLLEQASWLYERRAEHDRQQQFDAVAVLGEWGVFSSRHLQALTGVVHSTTLKLSPKTAKTGGKFDPECLRPLLNLAQARAREEVIPPEAVQEALAVGGGTSPGMASKLTGIPESWIRRRLTSAK